LIFFNDKIYEAADSKRKDRLEMITLSSRRRYHLLYLFREFKRIFGKSLCRLRKMFHFQKVIVNSGNRKSCLRVGLLAS